MLLVLPLSLMTMTAFGRAYFLTRVLLFCFCYQSHLETPLKYFALKIIVKSLYHTSCSLVCLHIYVGLIENKPKPSLYREVNPLPHLRQKRGVVGRGGEGMRVKKEIFKGSSVMQATNALCDIWQMSTSG